MNGIEIKLDNQAIQRLEKAILEAAQTAMEDVKSEIINTVPLDQGGLQNSINVITTKDDNEIHSFLGHDVLYARYLYYGKLMVDPNTKSSWAGEGVKKEVTDKKLNFKNGRTDHWLEPYISGDKKDFVKEHFAEELKRRLQK